MTGIEAAMLAAGYSATAAAAAAAVVAAVVSAALSMALNLIIGAIAGPPTVSARRAQLQVSGRNGVQPREMVYGRIRKGGTIVFMDSVRNETNLLMVIAFAGHQVEAIDEVYFFEDVAIDQNGVVQKKWKNVVTFEKFTNGGVSSILLAEAAGWTSAHALNGIAYIVLKLKFNANVFHEIPNVSAMIRGKRVYDPRDTTTKWSNNAALCTADYFKDSLYGLNAAYGTEIDTAELITSANECDEVVATKSGRTLAFDGNDDEVRIGKVLDQTSSLTIEARVRPDSITIAGMKVLDKSNGSDGFSLQIESDKVRFVTRDLSNVTLDTGTGQMVADTWKHIAAVWNAGTGTKTIYVDGVQQAQATSVTGTLVANDVKMKIGDKFKGRIQDVRLWNDPRSVAEVLAYKDKTLEGNEANLAAYWKLDEKQGERAEDATEIANDGTIDGAKWLDDTAVLGSERRYASNGVVFSDQMPKEIIEELLSSMGGSAVYSGGKWFIHAAAFETPTVELDEDDARDSIRVQSEKSRKELFNAVRGTFNAPENEFQAADFPLVVNPTFETEDGGDRITQDIALPFTTSSSTAQRLAWLHLLRNRRQITVNYPTKLSALRLKAGNFVGITNSRLGWNSKDFEVTGWTLVEVEDDDGNPAIGIDLELREADAGAFTFNPATDEIPMLPSPRTQLASAFGRSSTVEFFINRTGFEPVKYLPWAFNWAGTIVGMVPNPWTGALNVDDQIGAVGNNFDVFDQYVQTPVISASYETAEVSLRFIDTVRISIDGAVYKGADETGAYGVVTKYDARDSAGVDYEGWKEYIVSTTAEALLFKQRIEFDFSKGVGAYLAGFTQVIDKSTIENKQESRTIEVGGSRIEFDNPYHNKPSVSFAVLGASPRNIILTAVDEDGFNAAALDMSSVDVGGSISWTARGI